MAIFGDGCAAAVIEKGTTGPTVAASKVHQIEGTLDVVRMELSDQDSYLHLDRDLPDVADRSPGRSAHPRLRPGSVAPS